MSKTKDIVYVAMVAAITAVVSQITIVLPVTPVPVNLGVIGGYVGGVLLGPKKGALSQVVYVMLGAIGLPVFANFSGGLSRLVGHSGGFIIGYISIAYVVGLLTTKKRSVIHLGLSLTVGLLSCYLLGLVWFMYVMQLNIATAFYMSILPFILFDILKIVMITPVLYKLNKLLHLS